MALPHLQIIAAADQAAALAAEEQGASIDLQTALLVLVAVLLIFVFKALADVRSRLDRLEDGPAGFRSAGRRPEQGGDAGIPDEIVAVIAASVVATVGGAHRIVALQPVSPEARAWSLEGRRQVFQSHQFR
jgi:hypothetical protein